MHGRDAEAASPVIVLRCAPMARAPAYPPHVGTIADKIRIGHSVTVNCGNREWIYDRLIWPRRRRATALRLGHHDPCRGHVFAFAVIDELEHLLREISPPSMPGAENRIVDVGFVLSLGHG